MRLINSPLSPFTLRQVCLSYGSVRSITAADDMHRHLLFGSGSRHLYVEYIAENDNSTHKSKTLDSPPSIKNLILSTSNGTTTLSPHSTPTEHLYIRRRALQPVRKPAFVISLTPSLGNGRTSTLHDLRRQSPNSRLHFTAR